MTLALLLCVFASDLQAPVPADAGGIEIVRTWTGEASDHLGIGLSALGDVDADGTPDFVFGAMRGAYMCGFGPGYAQVVSGKDGHVLYTVRGTNKDGDCGDAYGDTIAALGDLDSDGIPDFAVGAWRYEEYRGYVTVYSGKAGMVLATIYGTFGDTKSVRVERGQPARPPEHCGAFGGSGFGNAITSLGDLDLDGVPDFAVGGDCGGDPSWIVSGSSFGVRGPLPGGVLGRVGRESQIAKAGTILSSSHSSLEFRSGVTLELERRIPVLSQWITETWGDIDHDGLSDIVRVQQLLPGRPDGENPASKLAVQFLSGKDAHALHSLDLDCTGFPYEPVAGPLGDIDGDGRSDGFVTARLTNRRSLVWILDGRTGGVLAQELHPSWTFARRFVPLGDIDRDGRPEFLLSDYESSAGAGCGGAVHLVRLHVKGP